MFFFPIRWLDGNTTSTAIYWFLLLWPSRHGDGAFCSRPGVFGESFVDRTRRLLRSQHQLGGAERQALAAARTPIDNPRRHIQADVHQLRLDPARSASCVFGRAIAMSGIRRLLLQALTTPERWMGPRRILTPIPSVTTPLSSTLPRRNNTPSCLEKKKPLLTLSFDRRAVSWSVLRVRSLLRAGSQRLLSNRELR